MNPRNLKIVEGVEGIWHYHLSETGKNGQPSLCGNKDVMFTQLPLRCWKMPGGHIPMSYCKKCDEICTNLNKSSKGHTK